MTSPGLLTWLTGTAVQAARAGDRELVGEMVGRIAASSDVLDLSAAARVFADLARRALHTLYGPLTTGERWVIDDLGSAAEIPHHVWALRLVTAYANGDDGLVLALVAAVAKASVDSRSQSLRSLLGYAAELEREAAQQNNHTEGTP
ncbi:hypothetical protein ACH4Q7_22410 [Streptomyces roseolus]|uniref:hypothetical protein n=1 Tax=Streptomyces roseolus TaxID=67358 RepID=UPI00379D09A1